MYLKLTIHHPPFTLITRYAYRIFCKNGCYPVFSIQVLSGRLKLNVAPLSALFSAHIFPPCASTIPFEMKSPSPVPISDLDANFVKSLDEISYSLPLPIFLTTI